MNAALSQYQAPCPHYSECGGCSLQHLQPQEYYDYKQTILVKCIASLGVPDSVIAPIIRIGEKNRRRVEFKVSVRKGDISIGFFKEKTHDVFDLSVCLVTQDNLVAFVPAFKECLKGLKKPGVIKSLSLTALDSNVDATITQLGTMPANDQQLLISFAEEHNIARLSIKTEGSTSIITVYDKTDAIVSFGGYGVRLPSGGFLQATKAGQDAITERVVSHLRSSKNVADLYSGCGTYSFPLLKQISHITAYEGSEDMVAAMHNAILHHGLEGRLRVTVRDLFKFPLNTNILNRFDGIVINPPRTGALPQVKSIANSTVKTVVMVSCNPATFKRDAKCLIESGYTLTSATAIDQFYWNKHLEIVAIFVR